jgi:Mor family transcriptional regulator
MRYLLKKAMNQNTKIEVVLHSSDDPSEYKSLLKKHKLSKENIDAIIERLNLPEKRYKSFFNKDMINIFYYGLDGYIEKETENE